jgi:hypothetical protein
MIFRILSQIAVLAGISQGSDHRWSFFRAQPLQLVLQLFQTFAGHGDLFHDEAVRKFAKPAARPDRGGHQRTFHLSITQTQNER